MLKPTPEETHLDPWDCEEQQGWMDLGKAGSRLKASRPQATHAGVRSPHASTAFVGGGMGWCENSPQTAVSAPRTDAPSSWGSETSAGVGNASPRHAVDIEPKTIEAQFRKSFHLPCNCLKGLR